MNLNHLKNIFVGQLVNTTAGPIVSSNVFDEQLKSYLDVYEWSVYNGAKLSNPLPFGMFGEILPINMTTSKLRIRVNPGYFTSEGVVWNEVCQGVANFNEYIKYARVCKKVVPVDFDISTIAALDLWEAELQPLDETHSLLVKIFVTEGIHQSEDEWDNELSTFKTITKELVNVKGTPTFTGEWPVLTHTVYETLRSGWWLKITETFSGLLSTRKVPITVNLALPDVLEDLSVMWNTAFGEGVFATTWQGAAEGISYSLSGAESGDAQSSASVQPEFVFNIKQIWGRNLAATGVFLYLPYLDGVVSETALLAALTTTMESDVTRWPTFHPKAHVLVGAGMKVSVNARASASASGSISPTSRMLDVTEGEGTGVDYSTSFTTTKIPPTIHAALVIPEVDRIKTQAVTSNAAVGWDGTGDPVEFPDAAASASKTGTAIGGILPHTLAATTPAAIPTSGLYLIDFKIETSRMGYARCFAEVLNASVFA